jgi:hypothetical protein
MSQLLQFYKYVNDDKSFGIFDFNSIAWNFRSFQQARMPAAKPAPTFEDLSIDDKLSEHQRLVRYAKSSIGLQRLVDFKGRDEGLLIFL